MKSLIENSSEKSSLTESEKKKEYMKEYNNRDYVKDNKREWDRNNKARLRKSKKNL